MDVARLQDLLTDDDRSPGERGRFAALPPPPDPLGLYYRDGHFTCLRRKPREKIL